MKYFFSAFMFILFSAVYPLTSYSQSSDNEQKVLERISKLDEVCGSWTGNTGAASMELSLEMEETSSAIGELQKKDKVYFIHCFVDDMDKTDAYTAGPSGKYDYCMLEQDSGENVGVYYLSIKDDFLTGIYVSGSVAVPVSLTRQASSAGHEVSFDMEAADEDKWENARYLDTSEAYEAYLEEFPSGKHVAEARSLLLSIDDRQAWEKAEEQNTMASYLEYLDSFIQTKAYANKAVGRIAMMEAVAADASGDYEAALTALETVEANIGLSLEALELKNRNLEAKIYQKYLDSVTPEDIIKNGIEYVNNFVHGAHRAEVSDRVAYMMASTPAYLNGVLAETMLTYAQTEETRQYVITETRKAARQRTKVSTTGSNVGFNGGIGASVQMPASLYSPMYGGHFLFSIGNNKNFFNLEFGVRYSYWQFGLVLKDKGKVDFHQLRLVAAPKFNVLRQKNSAFYMYVAPEVGYGYPIDMHGTRMYNANSISGGARIGVGLGRFDLSATYNYDYIPVVTSDFPPRRYSPHQLGFAFTFYFAAYEGK